MKAKKKLLVALLAITMVFVIATICVLASRPQPEPPVDENVTVTFYNGSEVYETATVEKGSKLTLPKAPKAEKGKGLAGWTTIDGDIEEVIDPDTFVVEKDISLYALWADVYTVTINADNGTPFTVKEVFAGTILEQPEDPIKEGFKFVEWRDALAEKPYDFSQPIYGNLILKAMYGDGASNRVSDTKWDFSTGVHGSWIGAQGGWNYEINGLPAKDMVYQTTEDGYAAWGFTLTDSLDNIPVVDGNNAAGLGMKYIYNEGISVPANKAKLVVVYLKPKYYSIDMATSPNDQFRISVLTSNGGMIYGYGSGSEDWSLRTDAGSKNMIQVDHMEDGWIRVQFKIHELAVWSEDALIKGMSISIVQRKATPVMDIISFKSIELLDQEEFIDPHEIDYVTDTEWDMTNEEDSNDWFGVMSAGVDTNSVKTTIDADGTKYVYANTNKWRGMVMNPAKIDISQTSGILAVTMDVSGMNPTNYRVYIVTDKGGDLYKNSGRDDVSCYYAVTSATDLADGWSVTPNPDGTITVYYDLTKLEYWTSGTQLQGLSFVTVDGTTNGTVVYKSISLLGTVEKHDCAAEGHIFKDATCTAPKTCSACGITEGEPAGHSWTDATCTAPKTCAVCGAKEGAAADHKFAEGVCSVCGAAEAATVNKNEWNMSNASDAADWDAYHAMKLNEALSTKITDAGLEVTFGGNGNGWKGIVLDNAAIDISKLTGKLTFTYSCSDMEITQYRIYVMTDKGGDLLNNNSAGYSKDDYYVAVKIADIEAGTATAWTKTENADGSITVTFDLKTLPFYAEGAELKGLTICTVTANQTTGTVIYKAIELEEAPIENDCQTNGHIFKDATCMAPKTCVACGVTEGEVAGHSWMNATCTAPKTCSVCGKTKGETLSHTWTEATCAAPKTCSVCGATKGEALGHNYAGGACTVCGERYVWDLSNSAHAADWDAYLSKKKHEQLTTVITNNGLEVTFNHENNWRAIVLEEATLEISKFTGKLTFTYSTTLPMTNYRIHLVTELGGSLTTNGTAGVNYADVSIADVLAGNVSGWAQTENADGSVTVTVDLTTLSDFANGTMLKGLTICTVSEKAKDTTIIYKSVALEAVPSDHNCQVDGHIFTAATCTTPKTCSICGATEGETADHSWKNATCTAPKTCTVCGTTSGTALGHTWTDATCMAPKTCSVCGTKEGATVGHNFVEGVCSVCGTSQTSIVTQNNWDLSNADDAADWDAYHATKLNEKLITKITEAGLEVTFEEPGNGWKGIVLDNASIDISKLTGKVTFTYSTDLAVASYRIYVLTDKGGDLVKNANTGYTPADYYISMSLADIEAGTAAAWTKTTNADGSITVTFDLKSLPFFATGTELKGLTVCTVTANKVTGTVIYKSIELEEIPTDHNCQTDGHIFKAATCTAPKTCSVCGATEGEALGHTWAAATCINPKTCTVCGATEGEALGHTWTAATCTTPKTCSVCGVTEGETAEHSWVDATCTAPKTCSVCGATEGYIAEHNFVDGVCTVCGATEDTPVEHTWTDATCTTPKTCTVCGATEGEPLGHTWADATCTTPKTCSVCNATEGEALGHTWVDATCTAPKTCSACGIKEGAVLNHNFVDGVCSACGAVPITQNKWDLSNADDAGHWDAYHAMKPNEALSTAITNAGLEVTFTGAGNGWKGIVLDDAAIDISKLSGKLTFTYSCADMAITQYRVYILTDKGGDLLNNNVAEYSKDDYYVAVKIADIKDGKATAWTMTENADGSITVTFDLNTLPFYAEGVELKGLTICTVTANKTTGTVIYKSVELEEIPDGYNCQVDGHIFKDATCTAPKTCTVCGATEGEALGHTWTDATCAAPKTCSTCGATEGEALGHTWIDATCLAPKTCSVCGKKEGSAVAHNFVDGACVTCGTSEASFVTQNKWELNDVDDAADWDAYHAMKLNEALTSVVTNNGLEVTFSGAGNGWKGIVLDNAAINTSKLTGKLTFTYSCADMAITQYRIYILTEKGGHLLNNSEAGSGYAPANYYVAAKIADIEDGKATAWTMTENADGSVTVTFDLTSIPFYAEGVELRGLTICTVTANKTTGTVIYKSVELEKRPHNCQVDGHIFEDATCTTPKTCSVCGATEGEALGHSWADATCTTPKTCSVCGATEGEALGHTWVDATCTTPKTCSVCGATEGEALGHSWMYATCLAPKTCSVCGATEGEALGHTWVDATCTTPKTCSVCNATEGEALGHTWVDATCTTPKTCSVCNATEGEALGHTWTDATCTTPKTCSVCGATEGEALGHTWTDATCTAPKTCSVCGATEGEALDHTWVDATCTTPKTCSVCGATEGVALGHTWTNATCDTPKTCTVCGATEGEASGHKWIDATCIAPKTCSVCGATEGEALGHTWIDATSTTPKTCSRCGVTEGDVLEHVWEEATCIKPKTCKICGETEGEPLGHTWENATCTTPKNCTVCGVVEGEAFGHNWKDATCTAPKTCSVCNATEGEALGHTWVDATCTTPKTCSVCGETEGEALGHSYNATVTAPTCTAKGYTTYTCSCGDTYVDNEVAALGHEMTGGDNKAPTCTEDGYKINECTRCDYEERTDVPATGHDWQAATCVDPETCRNCGETRGDVKNHNWGERVKVKAPTCTEVGYDKITCKDCGATSHLPVAATGHSYNAVVTAPTCTAEGYTTYTCACGDFYVVDQVAALGHSYNAVVTAPTCTADGYTTYTCSVCGHSYVADEVAALGHDWKEATCTDPKTCSVCNSTEGEALGHSWVDATCTVPKTCSVCLTTEGKKLGHKDADKDHVCDVCADNMLVWDMCQKADASDWYSAQAYTSVKPSDTTSEVTKDGFKVSYKHGNGWKGIILKDVEIDITGFAGVLSFTYTEEMDITHYRVHVLTDKGGDLGSNTSGTPANYYAAIKLTDIADNSAWTRTENADGSVTVTFDLTTLPYFSEGTVLMGMDIVTVTATGTTGTVTYTSIKLEKKAHDCQADGHIFEDASCTAPKTCTVCGATEGEALGHSWVDATCTAPKTCSVCGTTEGKKLAHTDVDNNFVCDVCADNMIAWNLSNADDAADWGAYHSQALNNALTAAVTNNGLEVTFGGKGNGWKGIVLDNAAIDISKLTGKVTFTYSTDLAVTSYRIYVLTDKGGDLVKNANTGYTPADYYIFMSLADIEAGTAAAWTKTTNADGSVTVTFDLNTLPFFAEGAELKGLTICTITANGVTGTVTYKSVELEAIPAGYNCQVDGHIFKDATCTAPKTCTVCGETEGEGNGHSWTDATCTAPKTCSTCGETEGEGNGHSWTDATCTAPKTCSACGTTEGTAMEHTYVDGVCSSCGAVENAPATPIVWDMTDVEDASQWYSAQAYLLLNRRLLLRRLPKMVLRQPISIKMAGRVLL